MNPQGGGTVIHPDPDDGPSGELASPSGPHSPDLILSHVTHSLSNPQSAKNRRLPTAVTIKENIVVLSVNSNRKTLSHGFLAKIFGTLDKFGVVVDLISTSEVHVSLAIENTLEKRLFTRLVRELEKSGSVRVPLAPSVPSFFFVFFAPKSRTRPFIVLLLMTSFAAYWCNNSAHTLLHRSPYIPTWPSFRS